MRENKVICPYYISDSQSKIYCHGSVQGSKSTTLFFENAPNKTKYFNSFCSSFCYKGCMIARSIEYEYYTENKTKI